MIFCATDLHADTVKRLLDAGLQGRATATSYNRSRGATRSPASPTRSASSSGATRTSATPTSPSPSTCLPPESTCPGSANLVFLRKRPLAHPVRADDRPRHAPLRRDRQDGLPHLRPGRPLRHAAGGQQHEAAGQRPEGHARATDRRAQRSGQFQPPPGNRATKPATPTTCSTPSPRNSCACCAMPAHQAGEEARAPRRAWHELEQHWGVRARPAAPAPAANSARAPQRPTGIRNGKAGLAATDRRKFKSCSSAAPTCRSSPITTRTNSLAAPTEATASTTGRTTTSTAFGRFIRAAAQPVRRAGRRRQSPQETSPANSCKRSAPAARRPTATPKHVCRPPGATRQQSRDRRQHRRLHPPGRAR